MSNVELPRLMPVIVGAYRQEFWRKVASDAHLSDLVELPDEAYDTSLGLTSDFVSAVERADVIMILVDEQETSPRWELSELEPLWRSQEPKGVMFVAPAASTFERLGRPPASSSAEIGTADRPHELRSNLTILIDEIRAGKRKPASHFAGDLKTMAETASANVAASKASKAVKRPAGTKNAASDADDEGDAEESRAEGGRFEDLKQEEFTPLAWDILEVARRLGEGRKRPATSVRRMLAAMILSGQGKGEHAGTWLYAQIRRDRQAIKSRLAAMYPIIGRLRSFGASLKSRIKAEEAMTPNLLRAVELARRLSRESRAERWDGLVSARHLLGAALKRGEHTNAWRFLGDLGTTADDLRAMLIEELPTWGIDDDPEVWRRLLEHPAPVVERRLPTYASDTTVGPDLIGITREVEAMASLVSAWSVEPPLSIGLFGEWGSGKTFFMQKMKERVRDIASEARKSGQGQRAFGYYKNIVQVEFNAWHYVEGNLWASLVEHIFSNLRLETAKDEENLDTEDHVRKRLEKLLGQVREKTAEAEAADQRAAELSKAAEKEKAAAEAAAERLKSEAEQAQARARVADEERARAEKAAQEKQREAEAKAEERRKIGLADIVEEVKGSAEIRAQVADGLKRLGITQERLESVQGLREALREASDSGTVIAEGLRILHDERHPWRLLIWVLIVPVVLALTIWGVGKLIEQQSAPWMQTIIGVVSAVSSVIAGAVAFWKRFSPKLKPVLETVRNLKEKRDLLEKRVEEARKARSLEAARLDKEAQAKKEQAEQERKTADEKLAAAEQARRDAQAKQAEADAAARSAREARLAAERLARQADALRPERRIAAFIQDRASAKDYRRHLGVPALIRRDFDKLSAMFNTQREDEKNDNDGVGLGADGKPLSGLNDPSVVNRIILYIDDLDRCPPDKVVEVLRAIHLLLAFPLFVVIVAVDARWMKRSLKDRFSLMLSGNNGQVREDDAAQRGVDLTFGGVATPDDYLEKIFQVPFWIRPLGSTACKNLVKQLTRNDLESEPPTGRAGGNVDQQSEGVRRVGEKNVKVGTENKSETARGMDADVKPEQTLRTKSSGAAAEEEPPLDGFQWSRVEPKPRTLLLTPDERDYMVALASVIGRSPRAVKRFVNCYRLLKAALDPAELARAEHDGTFRTTMLLLGMVTGLPEFAPALLADLRTTAREVAPERWARDAADRLGLADERKWTELLPLIAQLRKSGVKTLGPLVSAAALVDRFSFSPVRWAPVSSPSP